MGQGFAGVSLSHLAHPQKGLRGRQRRLHLERSPKRGGRFRVLTADILNRSQVSPGFRQVGVQAQYRPELLRGRIVILVAQRFLRLLVVSLNGRRGCLREQPASAERGKHDQKGRLYQLNRRPNCIRRIGIAPAPPND